MGWVNVNVDRLCRSLAYRLLAAAGAAAGASLEHVDVETGLVTWSIRDDLDVVTLHRARIGLDVLEREFTRSLTDERMTECLSRR